MSLYGIELNEPHQLTADFKYRVRVKLTVSQHELVAPNGEKLAYTEHSLSFTDKPEKAFATPDREAAEQLAETYDQSWDAAVTPVEEGVEFSAEDLEPVIAQQRERAKERQRAARAIR